MVGGDAIGDAIEVGWAFEGLKCKSADIAISRLSTDALRLDYKLHLHPTFFYSIYM